MRNILLVLLAGIIWTPICTPQSANIPDIVRGKKIHDNLCISCHETEVYTRQDRQAGSYEELREQVELWMSIMGLNRPSKDVEDITFYLNEIFYRWDCPVAAC